jgi:Cu2+-exporting ATPase
MTSAANSCFHCGQPLPTHGHYAVTIDNAVQPMCCPGCQAVAQAIVDNHLSDYYRYRTANSGTARELVPEALQKIAVYDNPKLQAQFVITTDDPKIQQTSLILEGIVCAACVWLSEKHIQHLAGVVEFRVNYTTHRAFLQWDSSLIKLSEILQAISAIGYLAHPLDAQRQEEVFKRERARALRRLAIAGLGSMQVMMLAVALYAGSYAGIDTELAHFFRWVSMLMATPVVLYSAWPFYLAAWRDVRVRQLGMDVPVALSLILAYVASLWATLTQQGDIYFDSITMFIFFLLSGRYLEMQARHRAGDTAEAMVKLIPAMATRLAANDQEEIIPVSELAPGERVRIKPGETVPADGVITAGRSSVDESLLTGESVPQSRTRGDRVIGGSTNIESPLEMTVEKVGQDTVLAAIQQLLDRAQREKPSLAKLADQVASYFVLAILIFAAVVALSWWRIEPGQMLWVVVSVLVVSCPCALSLATPVALVAATNRLMKLGILTTRGHAIETLSRVTHVVFDKTGTLTYGHLQLDSVVISGPLDLARCLALATALERGSEHPLAKAMLSSATTPMLAVNDLLAVPGQGMQGEIDGVRYRIGRLEYSKPENISCEIDATRVQTRIILADPTQVLAVFYFQDRLREEAAAAVQGLRDLGVEVMLLSGDRTAVVEQVAHAIGITQWSGELTPSDKVARVEQLQQQGHVVAMIGDGINDAPVLARAQVSLAMGKGTQLAQNSADMVLLSERLPHVPLAIALSRRTLRIIRENLSWAVLYNVSALPLAAMGFITPWMAGIGMSASSLLVVLNALRLSRVENTAVPLANGTITLSSAAKA